MTSGTGMQLDLGSQAKAGQAVHAQAEQFTTELKGLVARCESMMADYKGASASAFFTVVGQWVEDADDFIEAYDQFAFQLGEVDKTASSSQDDAVALFQKLNTRKH